MTINTSPFLAVTSGYAIAASTSYLYACTGGLGVFAKLIRSADGVDWADDPATITGVGTLVDGPSHIVLTGGFTGPIGAKVLAKSGTIWTDIGAIAETTTGGRFIGAHYFVIADYKLYYSTDTVTWNSITLPYFVRDVGYDGTNYVILTTARIYRTENLSTLTAFPIPFSGHSIAYLDGVYWVSGFTGATPTRIYRSNDLNSFTLTWYSPGGVYANLSVVDGVLIYGGSQVTDSGGDGITGYYYYDPDIAGYTQNLIVADGYTDNAGRLNLAHKHQLLIWNGYVYTSGGSIKRALYNTDWRAAENPNTATIQGTLRLDTSDGPFAARKVYLYDYTTGTLVAETTSDGTTGVWQFTQVAPGEYFVVGAAQGDDLNIPRDFDAMGVITVV
jgi:hypothetical protein